MKKYAALTALLILSPPLLASAQIVITEVMYDLEGSDTKREWVEVHNTTGEAVDVREWKFFEADTNHSLTAVGFDGVLPAGGRAIIAHTAETFLSDWPEYSGLLFDSSWSSLSNTGELLSIRTPELADVDQVTYLAEWGAQGDGNSLQRSGTTFISASPTPGAATESSSGAPAPSDAEETNSTGESESTEQSDPAPVRRPIVPSIYGYAGEDKVVIVGAGTLFEGEALGLEKEPLPGARYVWNFGNGEVREGQRVLYAYSYPGKYVVVLTVASGHYSGSDRLLVEALPADIAITKVTPEVIEITSRENRELDLSFWSMRVKNQHFMIPKDTFILPNAAVSFPGTVTGLTPESFEKVSLLFPNGVEGYSYTPGVVTVRSGARPARNLYSTPAVTPSRATTLEIPESQPSVTLAASDGQAAAAATALPEHSTPWKWLLILGALIVVGVAGAVFVRKKGDHITIIE